VRVLLVTANFRPSVGGIERFVEILAEGLAERGHDVTVATCRTRGAPAREQAGSVRIVRMRASDLVRERLGVPYPIPSPFECVRTLRPLVTEADVVHANDALYPTTVAALLLARRRRVPSVLTQHVAFVSQGNAALDLAQHAAVRTIGRSARLADAVTAYNPSVAEWARRRWGVRDVRMLPIGVPSAVVPEAERNAARRELGLPQDRFLALFTGRDVPKKRLDLFLSARDPAYELVAVTDRRDAAPGSRLVPFMSPGRFARLLAASDAFVLPSEAEGFPLALQEALVAGMPCVVTREPGYERFLADGDAIFVDPDSAAIRTALLRLVSDESFRLALADRARTAGEREFGLDRFVDAYEALYGDVRRTRAHRAP
jgi:D-inositol-3-phosphate glycosyltransferase